MDERQRNDGNDIQQNVPEEVQEEESAIETQEYGQFAGNCHEHRLQAEEQKGEQMELTQDGGQKQDELETQDYNDIQILEEEKEVRKNKETNKIGSSHKDNEQYPGASSQKRIKI
eukprot:13066501-Heterocapsa_arctica.AAC.1